MFAELVVIARRLNFVAHLHNQANSVTWSWPPRKQCLFSVSSFVHSLSVAVIIQLAVSNKKRKSQVVFFPKKSEVPKQNISSFQVYFPGINHGAWIGNDASLAS